MATARTRCLFVPGMMLFRRALITKILKDARALLDVGEEKCDRLGRQIDYTRPPRVNKWAANRVDVRQEALTSCGIAAYVSRCTVEDVSSMDGGTDFRVTAGAEVLEKRGRPSMSMKRKVTVPAGRLGLRASS